jgi:hypothetical protein
MSIQKQSGEMDVTSSVHLKRESPRESPREMVDDYTMDKF